MSESVLNNGSRIELLSPRLANQIAAATEEQSAVAEEVNRKVITIAQLTEQTAEQAERTSELSNNLLNTARGQFSLVERFNR